MGLEVKNCCSFSKMSKNFSDYSNFRAKFVENWLSNSLKKIDEYKKKLTDFKKS